MCVCVCVTFCEDDDDDGGVRCPTSHQARHQHRARIANQLRNTRHAAVAVAAFLPKEAQLARY